MATLRHLKIFAAVAACGTMHKAAETLYISQPSVSQAIRELEEEYGVALFDRLSRRIYITEAGRVLLDYTQQILNSTETMEEAMQQAAASPIVRIGGSVTVGTVYLNGLVDRLERAVPGADVRVTVDNTATIERLLLDSELDFAVVEGMIGENDLLQYRLCEDELVLVIGRSHSLWQAEKVPLAVLEGQPLISRESGSAERNQFEQLLAEENIRMVKKWRCTNTEAIKQAVIAGRGIAILSRRLIERELQEDVLRVLPVAHAALPRSFKLVLHKNKVLPRGVREFVEELRRSGTEIAPE